MKRGDAGVTTVPMCLPACQVVCVLLWSLDDYWYYSLFTLLMLVVFEATVVKSRMRNTDEMRSMANPASRCTVLRAGRWVALSSEALLPGDLISIARAPPVLGEPVATLLPADILLLHGTAVVNESSLTGESTPQRKAHYIVHYIVHYIMHCIVHHIVHYIVHCLIT